jgi:hypothetical protein
VKVEAVRVGDTALEALVVFGAGEPLRTSAYPSAPERALGLLPGLRGHRCDNGAGASFADEVADTEIAHLLEHAALELAALAGSQETLEGRTSWDFAADGAGVFRLRLEYDDDLVMLGALSVAADFVRAVCGDSAAPDIASETRRLRALRSRPGSTAS